MAIQEEAVRGPDCQLVFETATVGVKLMANWDSYGMRLSKVTVDFDVAQSETDGFVVTKKRGPVVPFRGKRGLGETFKDLKAIFDEDELTDMIATDWPSYADLVAEYGPATITDLEMEQPGDFGTYSANIRFGKKSTGYTEV